MNIVITGASRGIGYDAALRLSANPDFRVLALSRNTARLEELAQAAGRLHGHGNLHYLTYDLNQPDEEALRKKIDQMGGRLKVLINNAGHLVNKPFKQLNEQDWQDVFQTNFFSVVRLIRTLLPYLEAGIGGHILNIGSMGGVQGSAKFAGLSAYSASKAALANLSECLAEELRDQQIAVNCLALGAVQTEMLAEAFPGYQAPVKSDEMGNFVAWFATEGYSFFNGKILPVSVSTP